MTSCLAGHHSVFQFYKKISHLRFIDLLWKEKKKIQTLRQKRCDFNICSEEAIKQRLSSFHMSAERIVKQLPSIK